MTTKIIYWVSRMVVGFGLILGIGFIAFGLALVVNSGLKLIFFDTPRHSNIAWQQEKCEERLDPNFFTGREIFPLEIDETMVVDGNSGRILNKNIQDQGEEKTEEEIKKSIKECKRDALETEEKKFKRDKGEDLVNGISFLFVGLLLWIMFFYMGKKIKRNNQ